MSRKSLLSLLFVASLAPVCALYAQEGLQQQVGQLKESMAKLETEPVALPSNLPTSLAA